MTLYDHGCNISKPFKTQFQSEHSELLACVDHNQDSSILWFVASSSPHLLLLVSMGFNPFIRGAIGCTSPGEVFFKAMLEGGNNNKPPIWDLFYTTYKNCVIWRMNYYYYIYILFYPHVLNPFLWVNRKSNSNCSSCSDTNNNFNVILIYFVSRTARRKRGPSVWSSHGRTTCAWSAMVICTARVSASPMRLFAWFLARCVWCYQSLGPEGTRATRARGRGGKLTYGMDHEDGSKPIIAIFEVINIHWPVF